MKAKKKLSVASGVKKTLSKTAVKKSVHKVMRKAVAVEKDVEKAAVSEVRKHPKQAVGVLAGLAALGAGLALALGMKKK